MIKELGKFHPTKFAKDARQLGQALMSKTNGENDASTAAGLYPLTKKPTDLLQHFSKILTKHGKRNDNLLARINTNLRLKYNNPNPIEVAVEAIKPLIRYYRPKDKKIWIPEALWPKTSTGMAIRWIVKSASARTYGHWPNLEKGLTDEIEAILAGTSSLFTRRFQCHKNPN